MAIANTLLNQVLDRGALGYLRQWRWGLAIVTSDKMESVFDRIYADNLFSALRFHVASLEPMISLPQGEHGRSQVNLVRNRLHICTSWNPAVVSSSFSPVFGAGQANRNGS